MNGPETLDELVAAIEARGWIFELKWSGALRYRDDGKQFHVKFYKAVVNSPSGEAEWTAKTPRDALAGAFDGMDRMYDGVTK